MDEKQAVQSVNINGEQAQNDDDLSPRKRAVKQANKRQEQITAFVIDTVESNKRRIKTKEIYQNVISIMLLGIVGLFFVGLIVLLILILIKVVVDIVPLLSLLGSLVVGFVSSVISLLLVVVKYIFPSNEDETKMTTLTHILHDDNELFVGDKPEEKQNSENN